MGGVKAKTLATATSGRQSRNDAGLGPAREFRGEDQQLDRAIAEIVTDLKTKGQSLPPVPAWPDKHVDQPKS
jgi:hypothetical protein